MGVMCTNLANYGAPPCTIAIQSMPREAHLDHRLSPRGEPRELRGSLASSAVISEPTEPLDELETRRQTL